MNRLYFVSYGVRVEGCGDWEFQEILTEAHPLVWIGKQRVEELLRARRAETVGGSGCEAIFRLLSWNRMEEDESNLARGLALRGEIQMEEGL